MTNVIQAFHLLVIALAGWIKPYGALGKSRREFSRCHGAILFPIYVPHLQLNKPIEGDLAEICWE
jgi:hypothetical protein